MYSSIVKSLRSTGILTAAVISFRYSSLPKNQCGSVRQEIASAPAASYSFAICRYGKSGAINPFEGEAFFTSQMNDIPGFLSAFRNDGTPLSAAFLSASSCIFSGEICFFCSAILSLVFSANWSRIFIRLPLFIEFCINYYLFVSSINCCSFSAAFPLSMICSAILTPSAISAALPAI